MEDSTAQALEAQFSIAGHIHFRPGEGGLLMAEIANEHATALIALQGAQVIEYQPNSSAPVIFKSSKAAYTKGKSVRGGIPVCWPWFGPHPTDPTKPQHGFVRNLEWSVLSTNALEDGTTELRFTISDTPATHALWPHPFTLTLTVRVGKNLYLALDSHNPGDEPLEITEALHSYFRIGNISALEVSGLQDTYYLDKVDGGQRKLQQGAITISSETDRIYVDTASECIVEDYEMQRRIRIAKEGSQSTVVWNPWIEKSRQFADLGNDDYQQMICVEVTNAADNLVIVAPGGDHRLAMTIGAGSI